MTQSQPNLLQHLILFVPLFFVWYFLVIRPHKKKQKEHQDMLNNLAKNDEIVTVGGVHGTIVTVKVDTLIVRVSDEVKLEINKTAVSYINKKRKEK
ncbi:MAG: preprotein translocase subunit YajC [Candidatus Omnitrophica bacterium]|nr:preprotein translocase subunit YajC [Candidatus Omnitrophota bacterium]